MAASASAAGRARPIAYLYLTNESERLEAADAQQHRAGRRESDLRRHNRHPVPGPLPAL